MPVVSYQGDPRLVSSGSSCHHPTGGGVLEETTCVIVCAHNGHVGLNNRTRGSRQGGGGDSNCMSLCIVPPRTPSSLVTLKELGAIAATWGGWRHVEMLPRLLLSIAPRRGIWGQR